MPCDSPLMIDNPRIKDPNYRGPVSSFDTYIPVPCGRCSVCQRNRVTSWVYRLMEEDKRSIQSHFVTLTYDNDNVRRTPNNLLTLCKRDVTLFWKRLRKKQRNRIKYYVVGEYGGTTRRPHYHAIVFNVVDSRSYQDAWSLGYVDVGSVSDASVGYTAGYVNKASVVPAFKGDDRVKEFSCMSKGLGSSYIRPESIAYHKADVSRNHLTLPGGCKIPLPRYYRDKIYSDDEKLAQRNIINSKYVKREHINQEVFYRKYGDNADYDRYLECLKFGRHKSHISKRNKRNKL